MVSTAVAIANAAKLKVMPSSFWLSAVKFADNPSTMMANTMATA